MGYAYVGFELPSKINKVRRDRYNDGKANIGKCKVMLCPVLDKLLQLSKGKTTCLSAHRPPTYTIRSIAPIPKCCQTCKAWDQ